MGQQLLSVRKGLGVVSVLHLAFTTILAVVAGNFVVFSRLGIGLGCFGSGTGVVEFFRENRFFVHGKFNL